MQYILHRVTFHKMPTNIGLLSSLSVISRGSTVRHPVITKSRPMSEFGQETVTTKVSSSQSNSTTTGAEIEPATSRTEVH